MITSPLGDDPLGACAQKLLGCHEESQAGSDIEAATTMHPRFSLVAVVVVMWSKDM